MTLGQFTESKLLVPQLECATKEAALVELGMKASANCSQVKDLIRDARLVVEDSKRLVAESRKLMAQLMVCAPS